MLGHGSNEETTIPLDQSPGYQSINRESEETYTPSPTETTYQNFVRWLAREDVFKKLLTYVFSEHFEHDERKIFNRISDHLHFLASSKHIPQSSNSALKRIAISESYSEGMGIFTERLWPTIFAGLLLHDCITFYSQPMERNNNTFAEIWAGTADNQLSWSSTIGGYQVNSHLFWMPIYLFSITTIAAQIIKILPRWRWNWNDIQDSQNILISDDLESQNNFTTLGSIIDNDKSLFLTLWFRNFGSANRDQMLENLQDKLENGSWWQKISALHSMAKIADGFDSRTMTLVSMMEDEDVNQDALDILRNEANHGRLYAKYLQWSLGKYPLTRRNFLLHVIFMLPSIYLLYAKARLLEILIFKIMALAEYMMQKSKCEEEGKVQIYMADYAAKECTDCGDNPYVYYGDVFSSQGCMNGLLSEPRTPEEIFKYLDQILKYPDFKHLDLSNQHWTEWSAAQWKQFLGMIADAVSHLESFNISSSFFNPVFPDDGHIAALKDFFNRVFVDTLDMHNLGLGNQLFSELIKDMRNNSFKYLDISSNRLTENVTAMLGQFLANSQALNTFKAAHNSFKDAGIKHIVPVLKKSVKNLDISDTGFGAEGVDAVADMIAEPDSHLEKIDVSHNDFSTANMSHLGEAVGKSHALNELKLGNTNFDDVQADSLMSNIKNKKTGIDLDFSGNPLTDQGMFIIVNDSANARVVALNFNKNFLTDDGINNIADILNTTALKKLEIAHAKSFTVLGVKKLLTNSPHTLVVIDISGNDLGDGLAEVFVDAFNARLNGNLQSIHLGNNQLTDKSGVKLVKLFAAHSVKDLSLDHNQLTDQTMVALAEAFPGEFVSLDLGHNQINADTGMLKLAVKLPGSSLQEFSAANNQLGDASALAIAQNLVTNASHMDDLGNVRLSDIEIHALRATQPNTNLRKVDLSNNNIHQKGVRSLCRVLDNANISKQDLSLENNGVTDLSFHDCQRITGKQSSSSVFFKRNLFESRQHHFPPRHLIKDRHRDSSRKNEFQQSSQGNSSLYMGIIFVSESILAIFAMYLIYRSLRPIFNAWIKDSSFFNSRDDAQKNSQARKNMEGNIHAKTKHSI